MNINGIPPAVARFIAAAAPARVSEVRDVARTSPAARVAEAGGFDAVSGKDDPPAALRGASLWEMLNAEERAFFSDPATLGALTYRPGGRAADPPAAVVGRRIDLEA